MKHPASILSALALLSLSMPVAAQWQHTPTPNDTLRSVRRLSNGDVQLSIYAPRAQSVTIGGDIMPWGQTLVPRRADNGVWTITVPRVADGAYRYHFVVDGVPVYDPVASTASETSAVATFDDGGQAFFAMRRVPHGAVSQRYYYSETLGQMRRMHVWTPAGYERSADKLPVLYLVYGGGDTDNAWPGVGCAGLILDNLMAEGKIKPMVVVMPNGSIKTSTLEGEVPLFTDDMIRSIIPFVEANYRVLTDKDHRAMAGLSMGGMETLDMMLRHYDRFGYFWVLSSGWFETDKQAYISNGTRLKEIGADFNRSVRHLQFTQGGPEDIAYKNGKAMLRLFDEAGIRYGYSESPGGHTWHTWRNDLYRLAQTLFR